MSQLLAKAMQKSPFFRFLIGYFVLFTALLSFVYLVRPIYYNVMPGWWWIQYDATVSPVALGEPIDLELNRTQRPDLIKFTGVRSIETEEGLSVREWTFPPNGDFATAQGEMGNVISPIRGDRLPTEPGHYFVLTCIEFEVKGYEKDYCYSSNEFSYK